MILNQITGGLSNPTYLLQISGQEYILHKKPKGKLLPSAHAIDREYHVIKALADADVPVPEMLHYCADVPIIGTAFYVMEFLEGRVFHDNALSCLDPITLLLHSFDWRSSLKASLPGLDNAKSP